MRSKFYTIFALLLTAATANAAVINEIRIDQTGADDNEYVELAGTAGESLNNLTLIVIGDGAGGSGSIECVVSLAGQQINSNGLFLMIEDVWSTTVLPLPAVVDVTSPSNYLNFENSDNLTFMLVADFTGANGDDLDTNDDGTFDVTPWSSIVDSVALSEDVPAGDLVYSTTIVGPDGTFVPGHVFRDIEDPNTWVIGIFDPAGGITENRDTPGEFNVPVELGEFSLM